jgi:hypothetical protein
VHLAGVTANPDGRWVTQQARNLLLVLEARGRRVRFLLRDRDAKFSRSFDDVFRSEGGEVLVTPVQAPTANAYAERWVRTVRAECLDWLLIVGRSHLEQVLRVSVQHYHRHRPHRSLGLEAPDRPLLGWRLSARINRARFVDAICSTNTGQLHERLCAPHRPRRGGALRAFDSSARPRSWRTFDPRRPRHRSDADRAAAQRGPA